MLEPPDIALDLLLGALRERYGLPLNTIAFLPIGADAAAWAYRAEAADGAAYFVKVRQGTVREAGVRLARYLSDHSAVPVVAPLPDRTGALWIAFAKYTVTLAPFIEGRTGKEQGLTEQQWLDYGAALRALHGTTLPRELALLLDRDEFRSGWDKRARRVDELIATTSFAEPIEQEAAAFWQSQRAEIHTLIERLERLGQRLRAAPPPLLLCHADIHTANVLIDTAGRLWLVDWDEALFAPKECDLIFVIGGLARGLVAPHEETLFFRGYGAVSMEPLALAYYRHLRAVSDIAAYGEEVFLLPALGSVSKRNALQRLQSLFAPGSIVPLAGEAYRCAT
jgi:spectinomycin phosphotransferase